MLILVMYIGEQNGNMISVGGDKSVYQDQFPVQ